MFKIFPCGADKTPLIKNWQTDASNDPAQIERWRELFRDRLAFFGVPTGQINDILVLDVDVKNDNGYETLKSYPLPNTMHQPTPSGGHHFIFKLPTDGKRYGNRVKFLPGLDIRGEGGYVCYYGANGYPLNDPPQWLLEECLKQPQPIGEPIAIAPTIVQDMIQASLQAISEAPQGERNNTLNREAFRIGQLVSSGSITREYADQILTHAAQSIGLDAREIRGTVASGIGGGQVKPMTSPFGPPTATITMLPPPPTVESWTPPYLTVNDLLNTTHLRRPAIFEHWSSEDVQLTVADGGVGKSTLKLFEAVCLALGSPFLGFPCKQQGKTLYITGEDSEKKLAAMIGQILKQMGVINDNEKLQTVLGSIVIKKDDDLCLITKDKQGFLHPNMQAMDKILQACREIKPKLIVIDPIASFWGSEAALNDMGKAVSKFVSKLVHESNAAVEMINHAGKQSSSIKDMTQFAGRGGTGLVSHARISRVLRPIDGEEFTELTGDTLADGQSAIMVNVNKFSDGSPLYNKPFLVIREGYLFHRRSLDEKKVRDEKQVASDVERVFNFVKDVRSQGKYPTKGLIVAHFSLLSDKLSEAKVKRALDMLTFIGHMDRKLKIVDHPDVSIDDKSYVIANLDDVEI